MNGFGTKVMCFAATRDLNLIGQSSCIKETTLFLLIVLHWRREGEREREREREREGGGERGGRERERARERDRENWNGSYIPVFIADKYNYQPLV